MTALQIVGLVSTLLLLAGITGGIAMISNRFFHPDKPDPFLFWLEREENPEQKALEAEGASDDEETE